MASGSVGGNLRRLSVSENGFCGGYAIVPLLFLELASRVSAVDHHLAGIAVIALE